MENQSQPPLTNTTDIVTLQIRGYTAKLHFRVSTPHHDIILGKNWCTAHNRSMNLNTNVVSISYREKNTTLTANEFKKCDFVYINAICTDVQESFPAFAVVLKLLESPSKNR